MGQVTKTYTFSAGAVIIASQHNTNFDTLYNEFNGGIDNDNLDASANISSTKLNLSTIAQTIAMSSSAINFAKGSDIASATTTDIGAMSGNYCDITGTTTITGLGTVQAGTIRDVRFTGALTLTHNASSLILPTASNITTAANDTAKFVSLGSGNWKCLYYQTYSGAPLVSSTPSTAMSGSVIQVVNTQTGAVSIGTTTIPIDDTIPQNTEGDQYMTLSITPNNSNNKLRIDVVWNGSSTGSSEMSVALFQDSTANALAAIKSESGAGTNSQAFSFTHYMTAGTTSSTTFKVRAGGTSGTVTFNGQSSARIFGGVMASSITITEIKV